MSDERLVLIGLEFTDARGKTVKYECEGEEPFTDQEALRIIRSNIREGNWLTDTEFL